MTVTSSAASLLHVALEDLQAGKAAQSKRLPALAGRCSAPELIALVGAEADRAARQAEDLAAAIDASGPANLWMAGILDDAERDTRETQSGRLLDVALIGAIRKAKAAEIVSYETATALARHLDLADLLALADVQRTTGIETDRALKAQLLRIVGAGA